MNFIHFVHLGADNQKKISHLTALQELGELEILAADLTDEGSFDAPIAGCDLVFHVATPVNFASEDPEVQICWIRLIKFEIQCSCCILRSMLLFPFPKNRTT